MSPAVLTGYKLRIVYVETVLRFDAIFAPWNTKEKIGY